MSFPPCNRNRCLQPVYKELRYSRKGTCQLHELYRVCTPAYGTKTLLRSILRNQNLRTSNLRTAMCLPWLSTYIPPDIRKCGTCCAQHNKDRSPENCTPGHPEQDYCKQRRSCPLCDHNPQGTACCHKCLKSRNMCRHLLRYMQCLCIRYGLLQDGVLGQVHKNESSMAPVLYST